MFFLIDKRGYIATQCTLIAMAFLLRLSPESWLTSDAAISAAEFIRHNWPKIDYDASVIGTVDKLRAMRFVLASGFSVPIAIISTLILLFFLINIGVKGKPPYYLNWPNLFLFPIFLWFWVYLFCFYAPGPVGSPINGRMERFIFLTDVCLFLFPIGIGFIGTGIVRGAAMYLRLIRDGGSFPSKD